MAQQTMAVAIFRKNMYDMIFLYVPTLSGEICAYRFEGVSSLWREIFPFGSTKSSTWGDKHSVWGLNSRWQQYIQNTITSNRKDCICSVIIKQTLSNHWQSGKASECRIGVLTSTMALGRSSALNSCSMESMMFFQPSLRMLPCRWARSNTVLAAVCALLLLPNTVGRFSTDCRGRGHTNTQSTDSYFIYTSLLMRFKLFSFRNEFCLHSQLHYFHSFTVGVSCLSWKRLYCHDSAACVIHCTLVYQQRHPASYTAFSIAPAIKKWPTE